MASKSERNVKLFKALGDEKRLNIIELLRDGEKCACVLADLTNIKQSALSYHMKLLCESGLVQSSQDGKWTHYSLSKSGSDHAVELLRELTTPHAQQTLNDVYLEKMDKTAT